MAPANTLESFRQAIELGADMIETDVRSTRDGVPVLVHNGTLDETTNGSGDISSLDLAELKKLDAGSWKGNQFAGERIPTLAEALEFTKGKINLSLDLKDESVIPAMLDAVKNADMLDDVVICGCCEPQARKIRKLSKDFTILMNTDSKLDELAQKQDPRFAQEYIRRARKECLSALNVSYRYVTTDLIRRAHFQALPVWVWTVDNERDMKRLIRMGVDAIYTNKPGTLLEVLGK